MKALLRLFSEYSMENGICRLKNAVAKAKDCGYTHFALTDENSIAGVIKLQKLCADAGIKHIIGATLKLAVKDFITEISIYCETDEGYKNLKRLITIAHRDGYINGTPTVSVQDLAEHRDGLFFVTGNFHSGTHRAYSLGDKKEFQTHIAELHDAVQDRLRLALTVHNQTDSNLNAALVFLAKKRNIQCIISNETYFLDKGDAEAHKARYCVKHGYTFADYKGYDYEEDFYLPTPDFIDELAEQYGDILDARFAERVSSVTISTGELFLPKIGGNKTPIDILRERTYEGLAENVENPKDPKFIDRIESELEIIEKLGFEDYYIIVSDIILLAKKLNIAIGPGRGSGPGSLVAYCMKITNLDPLQYNLLFERFLNPERVSPPDFDTDVCQEDRQKLIKVIRATYGEDRVSQIGTCGTFGAKQAVEDAGKVLTLSPEIIGKLKKSIPDEPGTTLKDAYKTSPQFREIYGSNPGAELTVKLASKLEGLVRDLSKHAGGILISPSPMEDFTALYYDGSNKQPASQFDMKDVELAGLVKLDFLGLRTLTVIKHTLKHVNKTRYERDLPQLEADELPIEDERAYRMLRKGLSTAIFQLESAGMKKLILDLQPDTFEDIIALVALFRPAAIEAEMHNTYVECKHGREEPDYYHPDLEPILRDTYGVILYQEQVMQIAQKMAGFSLGEADLLRRAMGKKLPEEMEKQRERFTVGAVELQYEQSLAETVFNLIEKFASYGFNKSHSAAYAILTAQTAYLKAHYPAEFLAATMTSFANKSDKLTMLIGDAKLMGVEILPPDINKSSFQFTPEGPGQIRYGLQGIKDVGESAAKAIYNERVLGGEYKSFNDLINRTNSKALNAGAQRALAKSGALDPICKDREHALRITDCIKEGESLAGRMSAFEFEAFGMFFYENPVKELREKIDYTLKISDIQLNKKYEVYGVVTGLKHLLTKKKKNMTVFTLVDEYGAIPCLAFNETSSLLKTTIEDGEMYHFSVNARPDNQNGEPNLFINAVIDGT